MKALRALLISAVAAAGLAAVDASAQHATRHSGGGARHWSGSGGHWSGGHWSGHRSHWHGSRIGFYFGVPVLWGAWYWGAPYYYGPYYPYYPGTILYREVERVPESYPDGEMGPAAEATPGPGAPTQGPLYLNYCESAKAYYPKVTSCPEGWKFNRPN